VNGHVLAVDASATIAPDAVVRQKERIRVPHDGYLSLTLADGNVVEARGGTQIALLDFPNRLEIAMDRGQIWAHLKNRPAKPFIVRTAHLSATAHGPFIASRRVSTGPWSRWPRARCWSRRAARK